jgi:hypothetical protein
LLKEITGMAGPTSAAVTANARRVAIATGMGTIISVGADHMATATRNPSTFRRRCMPSRSNHPASVFFFRSIFDGKGLLIASKKGYTRFGACDPFFFLVAIGA